MKKFEIYSKVIEFFEKQRKFKEEQSQFNQVKSEFNEFMDSAFETEFAGCKSFTVMLDDSSESTSLVVNKVQKSSVEFDPEKLEKVLGKSLAKRVISKRYEIVEMESLIAYLKECGVDPKIFKSFLNVSRFVDTNELDRLEEIGQLSIEQVKGCYTVKRQKPYYTVSSRRGHDDGKQEW